MAALMIVAFGWWRWCIYRYDVVSYCYMIYVSVCMLRVFWHIDSVCISRCDVISCNIRNSYSCVCNVYIHIYYVCVCGECPDIDMNINIQNMVTNFWATPVDTIDLAKGPRTHRTMQLLGIAPSERPNPVIAALQYTQTKKTILKRLLFAPSVLKKKHLENLEVSFPQKLT